MGLTSSQVWRDDPRWPCFLLARYKFVATMFSGPPEVLEVGCADAFSSRIVKREVEESVATDFDPIFIEDAARRIDSKWLYRVAGARHSRRLHRSSGCSYHRRPFTRIADLRSPPSKEGHVNC